MGNPKRLLSAKAYFICEAVLKNVGVSGGGLVGGGGRWGVVEENGYIAGLCPINLTRICCFVTGPFDCKHVAVKYRCEVTIKKGMINKYRLMIPLQEMSCQPAGSFVYIIV